MADNMAQSYPVLDTSTVALDEPDYEQMRQDRLDRTRASMKVNYTWGRHQNYT